MEFKLFKVGGVNLAVVKRHNLVDFIKKSIGSKNGYICVSNTRTVYLSHKDSKYCKIQNKSLITIPDGMPLVWLGKISGYTDIERTAGPELFYHFLKNEPNTIKHYLLGDTEDVLARLKKKAIEEYSATIVGSFSPPFSNVNDYDFKIIAENINNSNADLVWLALGSPKQDIFASYLQKYTKKKIILNVGAAFRFVLGEYKMPPQQIQKLGLTGIYWRFMQKPMLFLKQYPRYLFFIMKQAIKIFIVRNYP